MASILILPRLFRTYGRSSFGLASFGTENATVDGCSIVLE